MIATKDSLEPKSSDYVMPNSRRVYVEGELHPDIRVPFREISLAPTKDFSGNLEPNEPVRVYDCSGPWGDPAQAPDSSQGLAPIRAEWIARRGDVAEYDGREIKPEDNGYLTRGHEEFASTAERRNRLQVFGAGAPSRRPLRASAGHPVTQLWYARQGIITPEMEFIAIRENHGIARQKEEGRSMNADLSTLNRPQLAPSPASRRVLWRSDTQRDHRRIRPRRSRARARNNSRQHQPPRARADDHRPQFPRQNQRQHR